MIHQTLKSRTVIALTISLLALSLPPLNLPQAGAKEKTSRRIDLRQGAQETKVFEQRRSDGEVLTRLRVLPTKSAKKIPFQIENLQTNGKLVGEVQIASKALKVRFKDPEKMARFGMDVQPDQKTPGKAHITLSHNEKRCEVTIDRGKAGPIVAQVKELVEQGKRKEAERLFPAIRETLLGGEEYVAFTKEVENSPGFEILSAAVSLKASLNTEEARANVVVQAVGTAASMLAPQAVKSALGSQDAGRVQTSRVQTSRVQTQQRPRLVKASYSVSTPSRSAGLNVPVHNQVQCNFMCPGVFFALLGGCFFEYYLCTSLLPDVDWWLCESSLFFCIDLAVLFLDWCIATYCHAHPNPPDNPSASGDDIQPGEALYADQSLTSEDGRFTFVMQGDGNLVLYRNSDGVPLWASGTHGNPGAYCILYEDGEFSILSPQGGILWYLPFLDSPGSYLLVQNDGNVVIYRPNGTPVWATNTVQP